LPPHNLRYALVTPAHNEAAFLPRVVASMAAQTAIPVKWVIIDDRSTDDTWPVISAAARQHSFIEPVRLTGNPSRKLGGNVVHVFNLGYGLLPPDIPFVVKMDADVLLPPEYFAVLLKHFAADPRLGVASGKTFIPRRDGWVLERCADNHVPGPCKTYRRACLEDIGGLIPILGWDILDVAKARQRGWSTRSCRRLPIYHLRPMGSVMGMMKTFLSYGKACYLIRCHPLFVVGRACYRALEAPYCLGLLILAGYIRAVLQVPESERLSDVGLAKFLRHEQLRRLLGRTIRQEEFLPRRLKAG
jgi:glycosyltransferase involved in cell wall biosynthesis